MKKCTICDGTDFNLYDGHYYCAVCQTQSQDVREEVEEEAFSEGNSISRKMKLLLRSKKRRRARAKERRYCGTTFDAFNIILKKQVDALISLGASPQLKGTVLKLWISYLECIGVASVRKDAGFASKLSFIPNERDVFSLLQTHNIPLPVMECEDANSSSLSSFNDSMNGFSPDNQSTSSFGYLSDTSLDSHDTGTSFENLDNPEIEFTEALQKQLLSRPTLKLLRKKKRNNRCYQFINKVNHMRMYLTLPFLYLGLLLLNEQIGLSDLIRWVVDEQIPFYDIQGLLPEHMRSNPKTRSLKFNVHYFSYENIRLYTGRLMKLLSITSLPPRPLHYYVARVVKDLSLPASICGMVYNLMSICPPKINPKFIRLPNYEGKAVAYLIIALKLIFCLDGETEVKLSKFCQVINERNLFHIMGKKRLFVYNTWRKENSIRQAFQSLSQQKIKRDQSVNALSEVEFLLNYYNSDTWRSISHRDESKRKRYNKARRNELYEALCVPFCSLGERLNIQSTSSCQSSASSFPLLSEYEAAFQKYVRDKEMETSEGVHLSNSSFEQSLSFLNPLKEHFYNNEDFYNNREYLKSAIKWYSQWLESTHKYHVSNFIRNRERHLYNTSGSLPFSVVWILNLCSNLLEMKPDLLYEEVVAVEKQLLNICCKVKIPKKWMI